MIAALLRRALCRLGSHHVLRCAGADDHRWTWRDGQWRAELVTPTARTTPVDPAAATVAAQVRTAAEVAARAARSAALPCRCGNRQDEHRPVTEGGCTRCPCPGFALTPREELDLHRATTGPRHRA